VTNQSWPDANWGTFLGPILIPSQIAKIRCILHYFDRILLQIQTNLIKKNLSILDLSNYNNREMIANIKDLKQKIRYSRHLIKEEQKNEIFNLNSLKQDKTLLSPFEVHNVGSITDQHDTIQVDFANEYIGGGVLRAAAVQEEIMFVVEPECLLSLLFCQKMEANESIALIGTKQFAATSGYRQALKFAGPYKKPSKHETKETSTTENDNKSADDEDSIENVLVAIDAIIASSVDQFSPYYLLREVIKAYSGFSIPESLWTHEKKRHKTKSYLDRKLGMRCFQRFSSIEINASVDCRFKSWSSYSLFSIWG